MKVTNGVQTVLKLRYAGPAVESGLMDVYQASANMIAFSEFTVAAAKAAFGEQIEAKAEVSGFGRGSFVTDLVFNFTGPIATIFSGVAPDHLFVTLKEAIDVWKHLKGKPPKEVVQTNNQTVNVTNNDGQIIQVQTQSLTLVFNEKASEAVKQFIHDPLSKDGIDSVEISTEKNPIASAKQSDGYCFVPVNPSEAVTDTTIQMALVIEAPVFKDGNKWRFSDGQNSFHADILDREFMARVDSGELFGKGDILTVDLRITQERSGMKISTERAVMRVLDHRRGQQQTKLF